MNKPSPLLWFALFLILLLPTAAGRLLLDLAGGLMLLLFTLPLILGGLGWIGWRILQSRMITCEVCGATSLNNSPSCPLCGSPKVHKTNSSDSNSETNGSIPASSATIDITAEEAEEEN